MSLLSQISIHAWISENAIKTEKGDPLSFKDHMFLFDIYSDMSPLQAIMKPAQIGASTMMNVKPFWMMDKKKVDIIYTLPADSDVVDFVSSKTNRIIAQNPIFQRLTRDRDTIEQKQVGESIIYYRGTWTKKAAMMIPCDVLIHDEVDASKQEIVEDYETRVQHSKYKFRWYFSHPSTEGVGVHKYWLISDQKHWFITCEHCKEQQYMSWPESIDMESRKYVCKSCHGEISDDVRRRGKWVAKYKKSPERPFSGYWITALVCPWITASEIIDKYNQKGAEYFYTKVLGLPYAGSDSKPTREAILSGCTEEINPQTSRIVIGVDPGLPHHYIVGNRDGIFYMGKSEDYTEIEALLKNNPKAIAVFDQGGDLTPQRALREKYKGRVFLCHYRSDRKTMNLITWGEKEEEGNVVVDRNRMIDMLLGEHKMGLVTLQGTEDDWDELWQHWDNIYAVKEEDKLGVIRKEWKRKGPDHFVHAELYWRVGVDRFGAQEARIVGGSGPRLPKGLEVQPNNTISMKDLKEVLASENADFSKL